MAYRLSFDQEGKPRHVTLRGSEVTVGRDPQSDLYISHPTVSREHARFRRHGERWTLEDCGATNRTQINGLFLEPGEAGAEAVDDGDVIVFGSVRVNLRRVEGTLSDVATPSEDVYTSVLQPESAREMLSGDHQTAARGVGPESDVFELLSGIGKRVVAIKPIGEIFDAIVDLVFETTVADRAAVLLWDEALQSLEPKVFRSREGNPGAESLTISRSIVEQAFGERAVVQMNRRLSPSASMFQLGLGSAVAVPLWSEESTLGVIYADVPLLKPIFEPRGVALLSLVANYAAMAITQNRLLARVQREERQRQRLEGYFSSAVVQQILSAAGGDDFASAKECDVTVLFCDMVGFTARSETASPHAVLNLLNRYFGQMTEAIFGHEGTLDKFIGDCIMCVFGAPLPQPDHARRAALAALDLRNAVETLADEGSSGGRLNFRIGLSSGRVVAGNLGHSRRREWTVLGSTVNLASRMESSVAGPGQIVLTEFTRKELGDEFELRQLPNQMPKGFSSEIEVYELIGLK